ncbi:MAG: hypothetical protein MUC69_09395 [Gemmatimonadales bacterium]|nr:hypothetical protein [Gemmatimonadales bacterium]
MSGTPDLLARTLSASTWYWGARLSAGALLWGGAPIGLATAMAWGGAVGAAWVLAADGAVGARAAVARALPAALVVLPEAVAGLGSRYASAAVLGLATDHRRTLWGALAAVLPWLVAVTLLAAGAAVVRGGRATSGSRRFPT